MAGKMRTLAKLFLGTTVLASSGSGAYYYSSRGMTLPNWLQHKKAASNSDLDAVASAWGGPSSLHPVDKSDSSPIARSAQPEAASAEKKAAETPDDRYATQPVADSTPAKSAETEPSKADVASNEKTDADAPIIAHVEPTAADKDKKSSEAAEPTLAVRDFSTKQAAHEDAAAKDEPKIAEAPVADSAPIARGQAPQDDGALRASSSTADLNSAFDAVAGDAKSPTEPKPLAIPAQPTNISPTATRAKQAFNNNGNTAQVVGVNDRYGDVTAQVRDTQPTPPNNGGLTPFNSQQPQGISANGRPGAIEPLHSSADSGPGRLNSFPQNSNGNLRPLDNSSTASSLNRDTPNRMQSGPSQTRMDSSSQYQTGQYSQMSATPNTYGRGNNDVTPIPAGEGTGKPGEKALEGVQQPTLVIQKFAPPEIQVGKTAKFVVQVRNAGAQSADGVVIRDEIPQGTKLISTSPNATTEGTHISWQIGKLSPGEDRTVEMQLMPTTEGDVGSVATVSYNASASVKTRCTMPQLAVRMTAANEVMVGNQQHIKIEVRNPGSGDATGVMLLENVPPNVKHVAGPSLEFELGTLHPNETRELDLVLTAEKAGKVVNTLTAKADGNLQVQQQVEFEVIAPGLSVAINGPERRYLERPATYEVSIENPGTAPAHDVQIVTKLPKGMRFVRANNMGEYDAATNAVYWSLAELPKGEKGTVELVAMPTEAGQQTLQVDGHAQQGLADHKQRDITVEGLSAIMFEVKDTEDPIEVNGETSYEIRVVNQGTKAATNVQVAVDIPPGLKVISAEGESNHKLQDGRLVFDPLQQLGPKADTVFHVRAQGLQPGDQRIVVTVNTDDLDHPIRREESTRVFGDQ